MPKTLLLEKISQEEMLGHLNDLYKFAVNHLKSINRKPKIFLNKDKKNAEDFFGKTGFYDPAKEEIHLFITDRHPKDILRSFAHELVHHDQNCSGYTAKVDMSKTHEADYASHDPKLREAERDAFERGNMIFRDWTDSIKAKKGKNNMNESKLKEIIKQMIQEMSKKAVKKGHEIGKAVKKSGSAKEPFAVGMAASKKMGLEEEGEKSKRAKNPMAYKEDPRQHPVKGKKGQTWGDVTGHEEEPKKKEESMKRMMDETEEEWKARRDAAIKKAIADKKGEKKDPVKEAEMMARTHAKKAMEQKTGKDLKRMKKESAAEAQEKLAESKQIGGIVELKPISDIQHPYPHLFDKKERVFKDAFEQKDERVYNELMKRFGFDKKDGNE